MKASRVFWSVAVVLVSLVIPLRGEDAGELLGRKVMLVAADVTFRTAPSPDASVGENSMISLDVTVDALEGDWLRTGKNWVRRDDVVPIEAAFDFFSRQIERQPTAFAYASRAYARLKQAEFEEALDDANEAVKRDPNLPLGYIARARANFLDGKLDQSLQDYETALTLNPKLKVALIGRDLIQKLLRRQHAEPADPNAELMTRRLESFRRRRHAELVDANAANALDRSTDELEADDPRFKAARLFSRALSTGENGDHRQAIAELEEAVRLAPELRTASFFSRRSDQFFMLQEYEKARADLQQAISLEPDNALHYSSLARVCSAQEDLDAAITNFERAYEIRKTGTGEIYEPKFIDGLQMFLDIKARDDLVGAHIERANKRSANGDPEGAAADFDRAVELDPKSARTFILRSMFLAQQGKYEQAFKDCDAAIRLEPDSAYAVCSRGAVYQIKGDMVKTIDTFSHAVILFPQEAAPLAARAGAWTKLGDFTNALDDINRAISLESENVFWYVHRARILRELKRDDEAAADFKKARELAEQMAGRLRNGQ